MLPGYEVQRFIARGGMGAVYRGVHKGLGRLVAIKILPPELQEADPHFAERFRQEARAMARLNHPGIVAVYDSGEMSDGTLFFVMEFIEGTDVAQLVAAGGRLPSERAMRIAVHVCDALQYAHDHGVVHRDIKPANIMVGDDDCVKVADFGLAKINRAGSADLTQSGMVMGTPHFMAPEALTLGSAIDHRADIYAVGVTLYQMLTGKLPQGMFEMPSLKVPGLDPRYDGIVAQAMREDRNLRYQHIHDLRSALDSIVTSPVPKLGERGDTVAALPKIAWTRLSFRLPFRGAGGEQSKAIKLWSWALGTAAVVGLSALVLNERPRATTAAQPVTVAPLSPDTYSSTYFELRTLKNRLPPDSVNALLTELDKGIERLDWVFGTPPRLRGRKFQVSETADPKNTILGMSPCDPETLSIRWTTAALADAVTSYEKSGLVKALPIYLIAPVYIQQARMRLGPPKESGDVENAITKGLQIFARQFAHSAIGLSRSVNDAKNTLEDIQRRQVEALAAYQSDPSLNWLNTMGVSSSAKIATLDSGDLFAALLMDTGNESGGDVFFQKLFKTELIRMPVPTNNVDGLSNLMSAINRAAGKDMEVVFRKNWKLPDWTASPEQPVWQRRFESPDADKSNVRSIGIKSDLLRLASVSGNRINGSWSVYPPDFSVAPEPDAPALIAMPFKAATQFSLKVEFSLTTDQPTMFSQFFEIDGRMIEWTVNANPAAGKSLVGFPRLDGLPIAASPETSKALQQPFEKGRRYTSVVWGDKGSLLGSLDQNVMVEWSGDLSRFAPPRGSSIPPGNFAFATLGGRVTIHSAEVAEYFVATDKARDLCDDIAKEESQLAPPSIDGTIAEYRRGIKRLIEEAQGQPEVFEALSAELRRVSTLNTIPPSDKPETPKALSLLRKQFLAKVDEARRARREPLEQKLRAGLVALEDESTHISHPQPMRVSSESRSSGAGHRVLTAEIRSSNLVTFDAQDAPSLPVTFSHPCKDIWMECTSDFSKLSSLGRWKMVFNTTSGNRRRLSVCLTQDGDGLTLLVTAERPGSENSADFIAQQPLGTLHLAGIGKPLDVGIGTCNGQVVVALGKETLYTDFEWSGSDKGLVVGGNNCVFRIGRCIDLRQTAMSEWPGVIMMANGRGDSTGGWKILAPSRCFHRSPLDFAVVTAWGDQLILTGLQPGRWVSLPMSMVDVAMKDNSKTRNVGLGLGDTSFRGAIELQWNDGPITRVSAGRFHGVNLDVSLGSHEWRASGHAIKLRAIPDEQTPAANYAVTLRHLRL